MNNQNYNQPRPPKPSKGASFFSGDMLSIIACSLSVVGLCMVVLSGVVAAGWFGQGYGIWLNLFALIFSGCGAALSYMIGSQRLQAGAPRGTAATFGLIFGAAALVLCIFMIFFTGCSACNACKAAEAQKEASELVSALTQ